MRNRRRNMVKAGVYTRYRDREPDIGIRDALKEGYVFFSKQKRITDPWPIIIYLATSGTRDPENGGLVFFDYIAGEFGSMENFCACLDDMVKTQKFGPFLSDLIITTLSSPDPVTSEVFEWFMGMPFVYFTGKHISFSKHTYNANEMIDCWFGGCSEERNSLDIHESFKIWYRQILKDSQMSSR